MRLLANLLHKLVREIVAAIISLCNWTPQALNNLLSLYKAFHIYIFEKKEVFGSQKPLFYHLRAYNCKVDMLIKSKNDPQYQYKCQKLDARAYIGFFIRYESTNIYWVQIIIRKKFVSVRDVIFNTDIV